MIEGISLAILAAAILLAFWMGIRYTTSPLVGFNPNERQQVGLFSLGPAAADVYAATMTIDVTKSSHIVAASNTTSAACTMTPSDTGAAGDILTILTEADGTGTVTVTFASTFHSSGTQATTLSKFSSIIFQSDGSRWIELCRTTALT